jgi:hypothetical protein
LDSWPVAPVGDKAGHFSAPLSRYPKNEKVTRRWPVSAKNIQKLDSAVASVAELFARRASKLFSDSALSAMEKILAVSETDEHRLDVCQEIFRTGYSRWLEDLVCLVQEYGVILTNLCKSSLGIATEDPAKWVRARLESLPTKYLKLDLSLEKLDSHRDECRAARQKAKVLTSAPEPDNMPDYQLYSLVGAWCRWVADYGTNNIERRESDRSTSWSAPSYCDAHNIYRNWGGTSDAQPDRLTPSQTDYVIFHLETRFAGRLEHILNQEEHKARIALASHGERELADDAEPTTRASKPATRPQNQIVWIRREVLRLVSKEIKGEAYCKALDGKLSTPMSWQKNENCPKRYADAYWHSDPVERKKWRDRICDERYKANRNTKLAKTRNGRVSHSIEKSA